MTDDLITKLEKLGENEVRDKLARGEFGSVGNNRQMVDDWLHSQAEARSISSSREQARTARSAKNAAWIAAIAAIIAVICAIITVAVSYRKNPAHLPGFFVAPPFLAGVSFFLRSRLGRCCGGVFRSLSNSASRPCSSVGVTRRVAVLCFVIFWEDTCAQK